jgi:hypothetical protein
MRVRRLQVRVLSRARRDQGVSPRLTAGPSLWSSSSVEERFYDTEEAESSILSSTTKLEDVRVSRLTATPSVT